MSDFSLSVVGRTAVPTTASVWNAIDYNNAADFPQRELLDFVDGAPVRRDSQQYTTRQLRTTYFSSRGIMYGNEPGHGFPECRRQNL
ncbi:MAG: hypothetical protein WCF26_08835 [Candidatus Sulfotelmatobacter sp.]